MERCWRKLKEGSNIILPPKYSHYYYYLCSSVEEAKILNLIVIKNAFKFEPRAISNFQISNGFFISLFLEQLISANDWAKRFYTCILSRTNRFPDKTKRARNKSIQANFGIGTRVYNARIPELTNNRFYCFVVRAYSYFCFPSHKSIPILTANFQ